MRRHHLQNKMAKTIIRQDKEAQPKPVPLMSPERLAETQRIIAILKHEGPKESEPEDSE
jgi:hypothetical protein